MALSAASVRSGAFVSTCLLLALTGTNPAGVTAAEEAPPAAKSAPLDHRHDPVDVESSPIITRYKTPLTRPRRVLLDPAGALLVCDWGAGTVLSIAADGKTTVVVSGLNEPSAVARDDVGNLFITTHAQGMMKGGTIVRISTNGEQSVFAEGLTGPTDLAFDDRGNLFVACFHENAVIRIAPSGQMTTFASNISGPAAVAFDKSGQLYVAGSTDGVIHRLTPMGDMTIIARGLLAPSDLFFDSRGRLIVANYGGNDLSWVDEKGVVRAYAVVPKGTISGTFDAEDNLLLVNWDHHFAMKVTTNLGVPCPHCGKRIPVRLRPAAAPATVPVRNKPAKPAGPVI